MNLKYLIFIIILITGITLAEETKQKAVLVTGASSGIGLKVTEYLIKSGFYVYAGARKEEDLKRLDAMKNTTSVRLDVTVQSDIDAAVKFVQSQNRGLFGIVNNAGVGVFGKMSEVPDKDILWIHDVNVMGPHRVNRAFIPLLKESMGRTTIIGSISGYVTSAESGAYSMSKFAVEAYTESLADDLRETGIHVGIVDPGAYKSKIRAKVTMFNLTGSYDLNQELTEEQKKVLNAAKERNNKLKEPDEVAEAVIHLMTSDKPKLRYMVAPTIGAAEVTMKTTLGRVVQLNADQQFEYTRDELVAFLDELLKENSSEL
ncbi:MAG: short-chain dehydrogenase/reductase [Gammaproteobacteria bacterium]|nr:MAG: short-chain dehydrogenase/reductase [Gammaproteobacteria bacterium]